MSLETYVGQFRSLHTKISSGKKLPNKAILLFSVMDLVRCGYITSNRIDIENTIQEAFEDNWRKYVNSKPPTVWIPFWHLSKESFWHFKPIRYEEDIRSLVNPGETASLSKMRSAIQYAYVDDELFFIFTHHNTRDVLIETLLEEYIKPYECQ